MNDWTFDSIPDSGVAGIPVTVSSEEVFRLSQDITPNYSLTMHKDGKEIGRLSFDDGVLRFSGNMDDSAAQFFFVVKDLVDKYLMDKSRAGGV